MTILIALVLMLLGFVALYFGAEWLVEGAVTMATHLRISKVVAGLILVAFGTSAPELFVNSIAAVRSDSGASFALSNISGSNLANLLIGFGLCAILCQIVVESGKFRVDMAAFVAAPFTLYLLMRLNGGSLPAWSALVLLAGFALYVYQTKNRLHDDDEVDVEIDMSLGAGALWFLVGVGLLYIGGDVTVRQAVRIGQELNISDAILGLTVVALGTSIPDITASVVAARSGEGEIAVGNLLGSNVFNVLFVIPMTQIVSFLASKPVLAADEPVVLSFAVVTAVSLAFFLGVLWREKLSQLIGIAMMIIYLMYMIFRVVEASA